jgi:hypothetical protein
MSKEEFCAISKSLDDGWEEDLVEDVEQQFTFGLYL